MVIINDENINKYWILLERKNSEYQFLKYPRKGDRCLFPFGDSFDTFIDEFTRKILEFEHPIFDFSKTRDFYSSFLCSL